MHNSLQNYWNSDTMFMLSPLSSTTVGLKRSHEDEVELFPHSPSIFTGSKVTEQITEI